MKYDCFISYNHRDAELARQLDAGLRKKGLKIWWDTELKKLAGVWRDKVVDAVSESKALVVLVSNNSVNQPEVTKEVSFGDMAGIPIIPLLIGEVPIKNQLFFQILQWQHVKAPYAQIDDRIVDEIASLILNIIEDVSPTVDFSALELRNEDIPDFGKSFHRDLKELFVKSIRQGGFEDAEQLLQQIKLDSPGQLQAIRDWLNWVTWYNRIKDKKSITWNALAKNLEKGVPSKIASPSHFETICPPVAKQVTLEWWRCVNRVMEEVQVCIRDTRWDDAARWLNLFTPSLLEPLSRLIDGVALLNLPDEKSFLFCGRKFLTFCRSIGAGSKETFATMLTSSFPPSEQQLSELWAKGDVRSRQNDCIESFIDMLENVASKSGGQTAAYELRAAFSGWREGGRDDLQTFPLDEVVLLGHRWDKGLQEMVFADGKDDGLARAQQALSEAGRAFVQAKLQAELVQKYRETASAYSKDRSEESLQARITQVSQYEEAVQRLLYELAYPLVERCNRSSDDRLGRAQNFSRDLESTYRRLQGQKRVLQALQQLGAADVEAAQSELQEVIHDLPEIESSAKPWLRLCEAINVLHRAGGKDLESLLDSYIGLPAETPPMGVGKWQLNSIFRAVQSVESALEAVDHAELRAPVSIPDRALILYLNRLKTLLDDVDRGDWQSAHRKLTAYIAEQEDVPDYAWRLSSCLKAFAEDSFTPELAGILTTPATGRRTATPAASAARALAVNRIALCAALGQVESAISALKLGGDFIPHNLAVAIFARLGRNGQLPDRYLSLLISCCALFACCDTYRGSLVRINGHAVPELAGKKGKALREKVGQYVKDCFERGATPWGKLTDPQSWACQWEIECYAVSQLGAQESYAPLPWPFGPGLIEFYGLRKELGQLLDRKPSFRLWFGPCAAAEAMNFSGEPDCALASLPQTDAYTLEQARAWPGYGDLPDPLCTLRQEVNDLRCDLLLRLLNRDHFDADTDASTSGNVQQSIIAHCDGLLHLRDQGLSLDEPFIRALNSIFARMASDLEESEVNLRHPATIQDAEARKKCMDGVIDYLLRLPNREWLANCMSSLRSLRSDVNRMLVDLRRDQWKQTGKPSALLRQMLRDAENAVRDDPSDPNAKILKIRVLLLGGSDLLPEAESYVKSVDSGVVRNWPPEHIKQFRELLDMVQQAKDDVQ